MLLGNEADNVDEETNLTQEQDDVDTQPTSPVDNGAKAYSERLNKDREKIRNEERESIAQSFGYENWDSYLEAQQNSKMVDNGLDPESVRPVLQDLIKNDPAYIEAMKYKAEKEELEKRLFVEDSLKDLNTTFGTNYTRLEDLGQNTVDLWNKGISLNEAYAATNWKTLQTNAVKQANKVADNGKSHLTNTTGSNETSSVKEYSPEQMKIFNRMGISSEEATKWNHAQNNK